jgi:hypothetical protein
MVGQDIMLAAEIDNQGLPDKIIVRGNYQQFYHLNCQHKSMNGVGMLGHLETAHKKRNPACMGVWDIILEHLEHNPNSTVADLIGTHEAIVCKFPGCGQIAISEKAMLAHNSKQHRSEAQWTKAPLTIHLGTASPEPEVDPLKEFTDKSTESFRNRNMSKDEAEETGQRWREHTFQGWEVGVREQHPTRSEVKTINEDGTFPKMIEEDIIPCYDQFKECTFEAQEGYFEMSNQVMRAKIRALRKAGGSLFGPKKVLSPKEVERRRVVAENARLVSEIIKST